MYIFGVHECLLHLNPNWVEAFVFAKPVFHFNRIVAKRTVFHCFVNTQADLMIWTQKNTLRFATIRLEWKTALNL